ncbi:hypothetical protein FCH31_12650 [Lelliottia amnigena]|nr:hypothetical protein [Lelliottia amnigena]TCD17423.1 hypothetical protein E0D81_15650 [Lelliottia amnigena]
MRKGKTGVIIENPERRRNRLRRNKIILNFYRLVLPVSVISCQLAQVYAKCRSFNGKPYS